MGDRLDEDRPGFAVTALRAAVLDGSVYRGLTEAPEHMLRALGVVLIVALAFGIGVQNTLPVDSEGLRSQCPAGRPGDRPVDTAGHRHRARARSDARLHRSPNHPGSS